MSASVIASTVYGSSLTAAASSSPSSSAQRSSTSSSPFSGKEAPKPTAATTTTDMRSSSNGSGSSSSSNSNSKELKDIILTGNAVASLDANVIRTKERNIGLVSSSKRSDGNRRSSSSSGRDYCLFGETDTGKGCNRCPNCPGFASHEWRQSCVACKCPRSAHALTPGNSVFGYERLAGLDAMPNAQQQQQQTPTHGNIKNSRRDLIPAAAHPMINMVIEGYAWSPPGLSSQKTEDWMRQLPVDKVPKLDTPGEKYRDQQLVYQLPKQDLSLKYCNHIDEIYHTAFQDFICARNDIALDLGHAIEIAKDNKTSCCAGCEKLISTSSSSSSPSPLAVMATRFGGHQTFWHPACFSCTQCKELLVDLTYCIFDDRIYCERHYAEQLKPRCGGCDELIFNGQYTKALNKSWHCHHFCCWRCDSVLTGEKYVLTDEEDKHPCCLPCYEKNFTHKCQECTEIIGLDSKDISYKNTHWHEKCFTCKKCSNSLIEKPFAVKNQRIFCGQCYDNEFASRCDACGEPFRPGMKKMEYKSRKWHDKCFNCTACKVSVGSKPFIIPNDTDVYCVVCFEEKYATKCTKCQKVMTTGGVTFKNEAWHRECFTCANCSSMLAGQKFASRNDQPYCAKCFGELFAKRCTACKDPITGTGGTRFISFEGRHWHSQCFKCAICEDSMAGKGFITDGEDIICPECARRKLMGSKDA